uniref:CCHC-type domain-containing protein n=1 Tax=Zosterops lateralis melanops TaxID=1220523 RepID=A0A8D2QS51_ZOSLA
MTRIRRKLRRPAIQEGTPADFGGLVSGETPRPLGLMLEHWRDCPQRKRKSKERMVYYCMNVWGGKELSSHLMWPVLGTFENWTCNELNHYVENKTRLFPIKQKGRPGTGTKPWDPLDHLPPPYNGPDSPPSPDQVVPTASHPLSPLAVSLLPPPLLPLPSGLGPSVAPPLVDVMTTGIPSEIPSAQRWEQPLSPFPPQPGFARAEERIPSAAQTAVPPLQPTKGRQPTTTSSPPASRTRLKAKLMGDEWGESENEGHKRLDEFLGSSIYTYEDLMAILRSLFNNKEREMIKQAGIRDWDWCNPQGTPGDQKWPSTNPSWNAQTEDGRKSMIDLKNIIIQGIREAVPRGQNISKVFSECQEKEESPTEWIERLRRSLQIYSGTDPNSPVGELLLKTQFVAKSWENIQKKLEKIDGWQDKSLQELLREAQKVHMRREDEKQKVQAKVLVAAVKEVQRQEQASGKYKTLPRKPQGPRKTAPVTKKKQPECYYCKKVGHIRRDCKKRMKDEKIFQED